LPARRLRAARSTAGSRDERPGDRKTSAGTDGIELAPGLVEQFCSSEIAAAGLSIGTGLDHRGESIGDCDNPGAQRNLLGRETVGIPVSVPPLVMAADDGEELRRAHVRLEQPLAFSWMALHRKALPRLERAGLCEHAAGHGDLADVVDGRCEDEHGELSLRQIERFADLEAEPRDIVRVQAQRGICELGVRDEPSQRRAQGACRLLRVIRSPGGVVEVRWHGAGCRACVSPPFGG
jgi:hypothetical protein